MVNPASANWTVRGKLAKLGGDLKGNPFQAVVDLIPHEKLQMERDISAGGIAEQMMYLCSSYLFSFLVYNFL